MEVRACADLHSYSKTLGYGGGVKDMQFKRRFKQQIEKENRRFISAQKCRECTLADLPPPADILESESSHTGP